ncbi:MAG: amino acid adenylation domain-containing protein [Calditrichaeota bacterium]|nr:MAG: amino acid adenylation domain-containing protein [Calditrichota bacterium]
MTKKNLTEAQKKALAARLKEKKALKVYPLSFAQERMWFLHALDPESPVYNLPFAVRIHGTLNPEKFRAAIEKIIKRHDILRTVFRNVKEEVRQIVGPASRVKITFLDSTNQDAQTLIRTRAAETFDLEKGPLGSITLVREKENQYLMIMVMHHIISDGWSMSVLFREFALLYETDNPALPPLKIQYGDFAQWQRKWLQGERLQQQLNFWKNQLTAHPPVLELMGDKPRPRQLSANGAQCYTTLDARTWQALKQLAARYELTDFMLLLGLFYHLLHHYTRQDDICIGTPVANRNRAETEPLIGFFVNTLVLRTAFEANDSTETFFQRVRQTALDAYAHQDIPFEMLVQALQPSRDMSHSPLFQAFFTHTPHSDALPALGNLKFEPVGMKVETAKFELSLFTQETDDGLNITFEYNTDLYSAVFMERLSGHFTHLARQWAFDDIRRIDQTVLLRDAERHQIIGTFNRTERDYPPARPLTAPFLDRCAEHPDAPALMYEQEVISYESMRQQVLSLAGVLQARGIRPGDFVGLCVERSPELVMAMYAISLCGAAYVPMDPDYPEDRLRYMVEDSGAPVVCVSAQTEGFAVLQHTTKIRVDQKDDSIRPFEKPDTDVDGPAYMIYTSGSTGKPKGVVISHRAIWNRLQWMQEAFTLTTEDRILQKTPYSFDVSVWEFFWPLQQGAALVIARPGGHKEPLYLEELIREARITTIHFVPSMLQAFLNLADIGACSSLKRVICSGEALSRELVQQFHNQKPSATLHNLYGPTEAAVDVTWWPCSADDAHASTPIGYPIANTRIYIMDAAMRLLPPGVAGELVIAGVQVANGYHNRPELTAEKFIPDPFDKRTGATMYRTGDLARFMPDGAIEFLGRIDHQVKLRGLRIELGEIENALKALDVVRDAVVLVKDFNAGDQRLVAYIQSPEKPDTTVLQKALSQTLPDYMVPALYVYVTAIPVTPSGKVDRRALLALELETRHDAAYEAPRGETEETIAAIFRELLGVERVSATDSFFDLGGHSLLATRLIRRLQQETGKAYSLKSIFEAPTPRLLARMELSADASPELPVVDRNIEQPLSFSQQRIWFLEQLEPGSPFYNIPMAYKLNGPVDTGTLEKAFQFLIARHASLRTAILTCEGKGFQKIIEEVPFELEIRDMQAQEPNEQRQNITDALRKLARHTFKLDRPPLFKVLLIQTAPDACVLLSVIHHIISDQWSNQIILNELLTVYEALLNNKKPLLPVLTHQFVDFAAWQRTMLENGAIERQKNYWSRALNGLPGLLELPTDKPRPANQTFNGTIHTFQIDVDLSRRLKAQSKQFGMTEFMLLLGYFGILLQKLSNQDDFAVGIPVANRTLPETQSIVGFFVNTLVIRLNPDAGRKLSHYLNHVRQNVTEALDHQDIPFEKLVDDLHPQRDMSHSPLFQVMFVFHEQSEITQTEYTNWRVEALNEHNGTAKFDLTLFLSDTPEGYQGIFEYNTDLFEQETIRKWSEYFVDLLKQITGHTDEVLGRLNLINTSDKRFLKEHLQPAFAPQIFTDMFPRVLRDTALRQPDKPAVIFKNNSLTFKALEEQSNQLAHLFKQSGIQTEQRIAIALPRGIEQIITLMGVLKSGAAWLPIDTSYPENRIRYILEDAGASLIITDQEHQARLAETLIPIRTVENLFDSMRTLPPTPPEAPDPDQLAYMIYTSGSTGTPKGTLLTHQGLMHYINWCAAAYPMDAGQGAVVHATIAFDATITSIFAPLAAGQSLTLVPESDDLGILTDLLTQTDEPFSIIKITPAHLDVIRQQIDAGQAVRITRSFVIGGENLTSDQIRFWQEHAPATRLFNEYGPTETVVGCVVFDATGWAGEGSVPIGRPINGTPVYVLDEYYNPVPPGVSGELYIGGPALARGYHNRPHVTAERFLPDPFTTTPGARMYRSGDKVRLLKDGTLLFLGRMDQQVKIRGYRIEPGEIEAVLNQHPEIEQCVVIAKGQPARLVAYYKTDHDKAVPIADLRRFLGQSLPDYMIPAVFIHLPAIPLTPNGKVDIKALPEPSAERGAVSTEYVAPSTEREKILADIVADLLKKEQVGVHDNFFELGGDSIMSIQVISRARDKGLFITPLQMFQNQTIAELAQVAREEQKAETEQGVLEGPVPLTPIQHFFFEQDFVDAHHWNQSVLFKTAQPMDETALRNAVDALLRQHDALRLRFKHTDQGVEAVYDADPAADTVFTVEDIKAQDVPTHREQLTAACTRLQGSLNLLNGPLVRVAWLRSDFGDHLLIVIHHLAVDGVSWRILLDDFITAYAQARTGGTVHFPPKGSSYRQWAHILMHFAEKEARDVLAFWRKTVATATEFPVDFPGGTNAESEAETVTMTLDEATTHLLLSDAHKAYNTEINDLLLTALMRGYNRWSGKRRLMVHMEGHGREAIHPLMDISRTTGWFTALWPLTLDLGRAVDMGDHIKEIKEQIHAVPHNGLSYGVLRYLASDKSIRESLKAADNPTVIFNYLGRFDDGNTEGPFLPADATQGPDHSPRARRLAQVEINGSITGGLLRFTFGYSRARYKQASIQAWAVAFADELKAVVKHCQNPQQTVKTASDFKMAGLDNKKLDKVLSQLGKKKKGRRR